MTLIVSSRLRSYCELLGFLPSRCNSKQSIHLLSDEQRALTSRSQSEIELFPEPRSQYENIFFHYRCQVWRSNVMCVEPAKASDRGAMAEEADERDRGKNGIRRSSIYVAFGIVSVARCLCTRFRFRYVRVSRARARVLCCCHLNWVNIPQFTIHTTLILIGD